MTGSVEALRRQQIELIRKREKRRRRFCLFIIFVVILVLAFLYQITVANRSFELSFYNCVSEKMENPVRLVHLSDLHEWEFGPGNKELVESIEALTPDLILITGDMMNGTDRDITSVLEFLRSLTEISPIYYQYGNHESMLMRQEDESKRVPVDALLKAEGIHFFYNDYVTLEVKGNHLAIAGISANPENYEKWAEDMMEEFQKIPAYKILLTHYPALFYELLYDADIDLALSGHYHGGLIRLPGGSGLYHPDDGFFPRYSGGSYELGKGRLIVSRGLGNHGVIPRINNKPELVVIDLVPREREEGDLS